MCHSSCGTAVLELEDVLDKEKTVPFGMGFAEKMAAPAEVLSDPRTLRVYASATYTTHTPQGPDDPVDDTER